MQLGPRRRLRTPAQRRFLRAAGRYHSGKVAAGLIALLVAGVTTATAAHQYRLRKEAEQAQAIELVDHILHGPTEEFMPRAASLLETGLDFHDLVAPGRDSMDTDLRIRSRLLLHELGLLPLEQLLEEIGQTPAEFFPLYYNAIENTEGSQSLLSKSFQRASDQTTRIRLAILLAYAGDARYVREYLKFRPDESLRRAFLEQAIVWRGEPQAWIEILDRARDEDITYGASFVVGSYETDALREQLPSELVSRLYWSPEAQLHSQGRWLARRLGKTERLSDRALPSDAQWRPTPFEFDLIRIPAGETVVRHTNPNADVTPISIPDDFWISDTKITRGLYQQYLDEVQFMPGGEPTESMIDPKSLTPDEYDQPNRAASGFTVYGALNFCNWLSEKAGMEPVYKFVSAEPEGHATLFRPIQIWEENSSRNGFRLPTTNQFIYVIQARADYGQPWQATDNLWHTWHPNDSGKAMFSRQLPANSFGVFTHEVLLRTYVFEPTAPLKSHHVYAFPAGVRSVELPQPSRSYTIGFHVVIPADSIVAIERGELSLPATL